MIRALIVLVLATLALATCKKKEAKTDGSDPSAKKQKKSEFAAIDLKKVEQIVLATKGKKFADWVSNMEAAVNEIAPGKKTVSLNLGRSRIRTLTSRGSFTRYKLRLTAFVESNGKPGWQGDETKVFRCIVDQAAGRNNYDFLLWGPDGKIATRGLRKIERRAMVAKYIRRKIKRKSGRYHTSEARVQELASKKK